MASFDPFPAVPFTEARTLLRLYFGEAAVQWDEPFGDVVILLRRPLGSPQPLHLTWGQAKYIALRPKAWFTIVAGIYPADWPA